MPPLIDLTGQRFSRLLVLERGENDRSQARWICRCDCGATTGPVNGGHLRSGHTTSCGCWSRETAADRHLSHGHSRRGGHYSTEYTTWRNMLERCYDPKNKSFKNYGRRGITVCDAWRASFEHFLADMGSKPSPVLSLDRIDNDGPYSQENCRWATSTQQRLNQRPRKARP